MTNGDTHAAVVVGSFGRGRQQLHGLVGDGGSDSLDRAELLHQFGGGRRVMGAIVEAGGEVGHRLGDAGVASGASRLGQRLVRGVAYRVAVELPSPAADLQQPEIVELAKLGRIELLAELVGERLQRGDGSRRAQGGGVLDDLALIGRELIEAGDDQRPQRVGKLADAAAGRGERGELVQEQRVATASFVQRGEQLRIGALIGEELRGELFGRLLAERLQVQRDDGGPLGVRRPGNVAARPHRGDQREPAAAE